MSKEYFGCLLQYPSTEGAVFDYSGFCEKAKSYNVKTVAACDILSLALLKPPGEWGADVAVVGSQKCLAAPAAAD
jgi:glycine dehydrogenase